MRIRALAVGVVFGFLLAVAQSCGGTGACGPKTCDGCCDKAGQCVPPSASGNNSTCGTKGVICADCTQSSMVCSQSSFTCISGGTGGGAGSTGGGAGSTGGGSGSTGGGSGSTGGGSGSTGGGSGTACTLGGTDCGTSASCMHASQTTTACFAGPCDVVAQNCSSGKCSYLPLADGGAARGCTAAGAVTLGQPCALSATGDNCATGLLCINSKCEKLCNFNTDCGAGGLCAVYLTLPGLAEMPTACFVPTTCDVLAQNCPSGEGCYFSQAGTPGCFTAGTLTVGTACGSGGNCVPGAMCIGPSATSAFCRQLCNLDGGAPTCTGAACQGLSGLPVGACI